MRQTPKTYQPAIENSKQDNKKRPEGKLLPPVSQKLSQSWKRRVTSITALCVEALLSYNRARGRVQSELTETQRKWLKVWKWCNQKLPLCAIKVR